MLHAIIIDDEFNGIRSLELLIKKFVNDVKIVALTTNPIEGVALINNYRPDIVFLDINMPTLNGFEVLEKLQYNSFHLIFTTAHQEYAIKAIKQAATDYLLKPIDVSDLQNAVEKVKDRLKSKSEIPDVQHLLKEIVGLKNLRVPLHSKSSIEYVTPSMIVYIEAHASGSRVLLTNAMMMDVGSTLKEYEQLLCKEGLYFMRIHNSYIINLNYVSRYLKEDGGFVVLQGKKTIPVSKLKKEEFLKQFNFKEDDQ